jgi:hypothetical protein
MPNCLQASPCEEATARGAQWCTRGGREAGCSPARPFPVVFPFRLSPSSGVPCLSHCHSGRRDCHARFYAHWGHVPSRGEFLIRELEHDRHHLADADPWRVVRILNHLLDQLD